MRDTTFVKSELWDGISSSQRKDHTQCMLYERNTESERQNKKTKIRE